MNKVPVCTAVYGFEFEDNSFLFPYPQAILPDDKMKKFRYSLF